MKHLRLRHIGLFLIALPVYLWNACQQTTDHTPVSIVQKEVGDTTVTPPKVYHTVPEDIPIRTYFEYLEGVIAKYDSLVPYELDEHLLVRANPWLIDRLEATDYYRLMERDSFVYDPQSLLALHQEDSLLIPDTVLAKELRTKMAATVIDINLPEFALRIMEDGKELYKFSVRVGQNRSKYLAMADRVVNLRTATGTGYIYRINRNPTFINPANNHPYTSTQRDDGRRTLLPGVPWIEPIIDGHRYGHLIHPTTNPETLGKAYSNGCIGMAEGDMWRVYYYAPLGTKVVIRYDLEVIDEAGDTIQLNDIYPGYRQARTAMSARLPNGMDWCSSCLCGEAGG